MKGWHWFMGLLAVATLAVNAPELWRLGDYAVWLARNWQERGSRSGGDHIDEPRRMVEQHLSAGDDLYLVCRRADKLSSLDRSRQIALSWVMTTNAVRFGAIRDAGHPDAILTAAVGPAPDFAAAGLDPDDYTKVDEGGGLGLWKRKDGAPREPVAARTVSWRRELVGLLFCLSVFVGGGLLAGWEAAVVALLLFSLGMGVATAWGCVSVLSAGLSAVVSIGGAVFLRRWEKCSVLKTTDWGACAVGAVVFVILAAFTLCHTFMTPNGLGVVGGKAKLLFTAGGWFPGLFADGTYQTLQPAYPPGFALVTLGGFCVSGGCGEWLTQLLGVFVQTVVAVFLCSRTASLAARFWILAAFLSPLAVRLGTLFYPEPFVALFVLVGWERIRTRRGDWPGWLLVGASGWFKNEGLVYLVLLWISMVEWRDVKGEIKKVPLLVITAALPVGWQIGCRLCGASLDGFASLAQFSPAQSFQALGSAMTSAFIQPWGYVFVFPVSLVAVWFTVVRRQTRLVRAGIFAALCVAAFSVVFGLSDTADFAWHLESFARILWLPSLLLLRELIGLGVRRLRVE